MKQDLKRKLCSHFQMSFLHLSQIAPLVKVSGKVDISVRSLGQTDPWSDVPPQ